VMSDYSRPRPAVLISTSRSGSIFLLNALDSHLQIGCERDEPFSPASGWQTLGVAPEDLMWALWRRPGYRVAMFKLSYRQARGLGWEILQEAGASIIHLHRENVLRVIVSSAINTAARQGELEHPAHSFERVQPVQIRLRPEVFIAECERYGRNVQDMLSRLRSLGLPLLELTYEDLVWKEGNEAGQVEAETTVKICEFLGVGERPLTSETRRINPAPLGELVENWTEVWAAVERWSEGREGKWAWWGEA
jgi:hypothetical protein